MNQIRWFIRRGEKPALLSAGVSEEAAEAGAAWDVNALYCGSARAERGNAAGRRVTGDQSLHILGIGIPHNSHLFQVIFGDREKGTEESREPIWQGLIMSLSLSLLLSWDVRPLSELANFVFTNHSVGCRERKKMRRRKKKKRKTLIGKPQCSKQRREEKKLRFCFTFKTTKTKPGEEKGAEIYQQ